MKIKTNVNVPAFLEAVQTCAGDVNFVTSEGDSLNLKSALSQFIFTAVIAGKLQAMDGRIIVHNPDDVERLCDYCEE